MIAAFAERESESARVIDCGEFRYGFVSLSMPAFFRYQAQSELQSIDVNDF
jgi:hypothetical protein